MTNLKHILGTTALLTALTLGLSSSTAFASNDSVSEDNGSGLQAVTEVPNPDCQEIRDADETKCNQEWHDSDQTKSDWLNYKKCMEKALADYLDCIAPVLK